MKHALLLSALLLAAGTTQAIAAPSVELGNRRPPKVESGGLPLAHPSPGVALAPGENFTNPIPIPSVPFAASGNTCSYLNDITGPCGGAGPEIVYSFTPTVDMCVSISLCDPFSDYDSIIDVFVGSGPAFVACNDDFCGLQSEISSLNLTAGNTYYIVVDGFGGDCGNYTLSINPCPPPCVVPCPSGSYPEGEPVCFDNYNDTFNAGCNSTPESYSNLPCTGVPISICGTYGTFLNEATGQDFRDTDWYKVTLVVPTTLNATAVGEATTDLAIVDLNAGCAGLTAPCFNTGFACQTVSCSVPLPAGTYAIFVATDDFVGVPCGSKYTLTVWGQDCPTPTRRSSWGDMKLRYR
jgi:hypothetical protein